MQQLVVKGFHAFRNALSDDYESLQSGSSLQQCDLQLELAKYCDKYLRFSEEGGYIFHTHFNILNWSYIGQVFMKLDIFCVHTFIWSYIGQAFMTF